MEFNDLNLLDIGNTIQITGVIYSGEGKHLLCMFPEHHGTLSCCVPADDDIAVIVPLDRSTLNDQIVMLNMTREQWVTFLRQTDILETEVLTKAGDDQKIIKAILRKSARQVAQDVSWAVYRRDGYACRYCGKDDVPLTVDHLVLWEEGGPSTEENMLSACKKCNKTRGNTQYPDWLNHEFYKRVSKGLKPEVLEANAAIVATLDAIPRMVHKPTRRK